MVPYLTQLREFIKPVYPKLSQDDRVQVYEAIAYVIASQRMAEAGASLRQFALDLVEQIHAVVSKTTVATKEELNHVAGASRPDCFPG